MAKCGHLLQFRGTCLLTLASQIQDRHFRRRKDAHSFVDSKRSQTPSKSPKLYKTPSPINEAKSQGATVWTTPKTEVVVRGIARESLTSRRADVFRIVVPRPRKLGLGQSPLSQAEPSAGALSQLRFQQSFTTPRRSRACREVPTRRRGTTPPAPCSHRPTGCRRHRRWAQSRPISFPPAIRRHRPRSCRIFPLPTTRMLPIIADSK